VKRALLLLSLFALCNLTLLAQTGKAPRVGHTTEKSKIHVAPQSVPARLIKIFSNLGPNRFELYTDTDGWDVTGPNAVIIGDVAQTSSQQFTGLPFTPNSNAQVTQVRAAVQYVSGDKLFYLSIHGDSGGAPGTLLAGPVAVTHLPNFGTCCTLAAANFDPPLAVTGGTQYWVVASTPASGKGSNFAGLWDWVYQGDVPPVFAFVNEFFGVEQPGLSTPAVEVLGTNE
jgi:hypothetical protein